jgi:hypothetical protein
MSALPSNSGHSSVQVRRPLSAISGHAIHNVEERFAIRSVADLPQRLNISQRRRQTSLMTVRSAVGFIVGDA